MRTALIVGLAFLLAGCAEPASDAASSPSEDEAGTASPTAPTGGTNVGANVSAGPPSWPVGQTWKWKLETSAQATAEVTTVVRAATASEYDIGVTSLEDAARSYPFHIIPIGTVARADVSWQAHGLAVSLVRFPPTPGTTWNVDLWAAPGATARIDAGEVPTPAGPEPGFITTVDYANNGGLFLKAYWSPTLSQFGAVETYFGATSAFARATLVSSTAGDAAAGQPFIAHDLVRARWNPTNPPSLAPQPFTPAADDTHLLFACFISGGPGVLGAAVEGPDGSPRQCNTAATAAGGEVFAGVIFPNAAGPWSVAGYPVGQGSVNVEIFGVRAG